MGEKIVLILSLGSNYQQEKSMSEVKTKLIDMFGSEIVFSKPMWTAPIGGGSEMFLNCLAFTHTSHKLDYISKAIKHIERVCGSRKRARNNNIVKIDIDILRYGNQILHKEDWSRDYIIAMMEACPFKDQITASV